MKVASIAELRNRISTFLSYVEKGEEVEVRKRNVAIARIVPAEKRMPNKTQLGCGKGTINRDPTEPFIPEAEWNMLKKARAR